MRVRVASLASAQELAQGWADRVVSLVDAHTELPDFQVPHLVVRMNDTDILTDPLSPKRDDIQRVMDFCQPGDRVVVHCEGGISRSTAIGIGLFVRDGMSVPEAVKAVYQQSPNMGPNMLILLHLEDVLQLDRLLVRQVSKVLDGLPRGMWLWCSQCQEHFIDGQNCSGRHWEPYTYE